MFPLMALDPRPPAAHAVDLKDQEQWDLDISAAIHEYHKSPVGKEYYLIEVF